MNLNEIANTEKKYYANTFGRLPVAVERGTGMYLYDFAGKKYLDMFAGIAVDALGHCHPTVVSAIRKQSEKLMHTSNWLYTLPQLELAKQLVELSGQSKAFMTNDGTEAVEAAIKLARKTTGKTEIIAMNGSFHGRTMGALSLTSGEKYRKPFLPLLPGAKFAEYDDIDSLRKTITPETAAVIVEPIQGEAGVIIPKDDYLRKVREVTEEKDVLLIIDEVQTGFGRTGAMFAFQHAKIKPDIICLAKSLGGGFPIGAIVYSCGDFEPGQHGGTFVGNPLACAVASAVVDHIVKEKLTENSAKMGAYLLSELKGRGLNARGRGLMIGIDVPDGKATTLKLIEKGVLTIYSGNTVRIIPPLIIEKKHADEFLVAWDSLEA
jgi:acetylornithine/N-succinyldiaminopimelate aminotransferase